MEGLASSTTRLLYHDHLPLTASLFPEERVYHSSSTSHGVVTMIKVPESDSIDRPGAPVDVEQWQDTAMLRFRMGDKQCLIPSLF